MSDNDPKRSPPDSWWTWGAVGLLTVWGAGVIAMSIEPFATVTAPAIGAVRTLIVAGLSVWAFSFTGWRLCRRFVSDDVRTRLSALEQTLVELGVGAGCVMLAVFAVGSVGGYRPLVAWGLLTVALVGPQRRFWVALTGRWRAASDAPQSERSSRWVRGLLFVLAVMTLLACLTPATSQDALVYHLAVPARYIEAGGICHVPGNFYASFPQNVDMLFTLGLLLDGDTLAKLYHWMLGAGAVLAVVALSRRIAARGGGDPALGGLIFASLPTAALISTWAYIDLGVVFFSVLSLLLFLAFWRAQHGVELVGAARRAPTTLLVLSALMAGVAAGSKYTGAAQGLLLGGLLAFVGLAERRRARTILLQIAIVGSVSFLVAAPWYVKNLWLTGNPLFPFAHSIFGGEGWDVERATVLSWSLREWGGSRAGWELAALPWDLTFSGMFFSQRGFDGVIGPAFLLGAPLVVVGLMRSTEHRIAFIAFVLQGLLWVATTHQVRFLLPALAVCAAMIPAGMGVIRVASARRVPAFLLLIACSVNVFLVGVHFASKNPLPVVMGLESRDEYMTRELPGGDYAVFRHINQRLAPDSRVLFGSCGNPGFLCEKPYYSDALFENFTLAQMLAASETLEAFGARLEADGFTHLLFRFENVFDPSGRKSEIPPADQLRFAQFLNRECKLVAEAAGTKLYAIERAERVSVHGAER